MQAGCIAHSRTTERERSPLVRPSGSHHRREGSSVRACTKEALNASVAFSLVILVLFSFAFDPSSDQLQEFSGGLLWLVFSFAGALVLNRSFARETQNDCLDGLLAAPISAAELFLGKALANYEHAADGDRIRIAACVWPVLQRALGAPILGRWWGSCCWARWALTVIGTFFSALTVNLRMRELMLPTLVYPLMIPALMSAMTLTTTLMSGHPLGPDESHCRCGCWWRSISCLLCCRSRSWILF